MPNLLVGVLEDAIAVSIHALAAPIAKMTKSIKQSGKCTKEGMPGEYTVPVSRSFPNKASSPLFPPSIPYISWFTNKIFE
ncbi:MAG: hypothetical protein ACM3UW_02190 [Bacillota bacterium]